MKEKEEKKRRSKGGWIGILFVLAVGLFAYWLFGQGSVVPQRSAGQLGADEQSINILLVGSDENEAFGVGGRADTIMVAHVQLDQPGLFILSVPRDTLVSLEEYGDTKINHTYAYGGVPLLRDTVQQLLGIPIDYYAATDFAGFEGVVDILGGVTIDVDKRMYYQTYDGLIDIEAGRQLLDGEQALQYVRFRQDELGDITRVSRQQIFLKAIASQALERGVLRKLPQLLAELNKAAETDLPTRYMLRLALSMRGLDVESIASATLPGDFADIGGVSYWRADQEQIRQLLEQRF